jgi:hypothetical protein
MGAESLGIKGAADFAEFFHPPSQLLRPGRVRLRCTLGTIVRWWLPMACFEEWLESAMLFMPDMQEEKRPKQT